MSNTKRGEAPRALGEFRPMTDLWNGDQALFPSEQSARWALRKHREPLVAQSALAMFRGRTMYHPQRFSAVIESEAIRAANRAFGRAASG